VIATLDSFLEKTWPAPSPNQAREAEEQQRSTVRVVGEIVVHIKHNLLGFPGNEEAGFAHVRKVYSHEQALGQCARFLSTQCPQAELISVTSTSRAAEMVAAVQSQQGQPSEVAAISSAMAAEEYKVPILQAGIQDRNDNTTRFLVLERRAESKEARSFPLQEKSLIVFTVSHLEPGALFKALETLFRHRINLTCIHQRPPSPGRGEDAIFVEVGGAVVSAELLEDLKRVTVTAILLGSW